MLHNDFMAGLADAIKQVCHADKSEIKLSPDQTDEFFKNRKHWPDYGIHVRCYEGEMVQLDLPSFPLPVRTITTEQYTTEDGVEIVPRYQYHSIVNFFLRRRDMNLVPLGMRI